MVQVFFISQLINESKISPLFFLLKLPSLVASARSWLKLGRQKVGTLLVGEQGTKGCLGGEIAQHVLPHIVRDISKLLERKHVADDLREGAMIWSTSYLRPVHRINLVGVGAKDLCNLPPPICVIVHPVVAGPSKNKRHIDCHRFGFGFPSIQPDRARVKDYFDIPTALLAIVRQKERVGYRVLLLEGEPLLRQGQVAKTISHAILPVPTTLSSSLTSFYLLGRYKWESRLVGP